MANNQTRKQAKAKKQNNFNEVIKCLKILGFKKGQIDSALKKIKYKVSIEEMVEDAIKTIHAFSVSINQTTKKVSKTENQGEKWNKKTKEQEEKVKEKKKN